MNKEFLYNFSNDQHTLPSSTLRVHIPDYRNLPLVIRKSNFQLLGYSKTDKDIKLNPGIYIIQVTKPSGDMDSKIVDINSGESKELEFTTFSVRKIKRNNLKSKKTYKTERTIRVKSKKNSKYNSPNLVEKVVDNFFKFSYIVRPEELNLKMKILFFDRKKLQQEKELLEDIDFSRKIINDINHIRIDIEASKYLQILKVYRPNNKSIYLVLPLYKKESTLIDTCTVEIIDNGEDLQFRCSFDNRKRTTLMLEYLSSNSFNAAADIAIEAEDMLYAKKKNPIGAVIGGYVLLRIGATERMHDWPKNLYNWFPTLSDGAIIAGELEARRGNDKEAIDLFLDAFNRGVPMFREGLSLLVARLRSYLLDEKELSLNKEKLRQLKSAYLYFANLAMGINNKNELLVIERTLLVDDKDSKKESTEGLLLVDDKDYKKASYD